MRPDGIIPGEQGSPCTSARCSTSRRSASPSAHCRRRVTGRLLSGARSRPSISRASWWASGFAPSAPSDRWQSTQAGEPARRSPCNSCFRLCARRAPQSQSAERVRWPVERGALQMLLEPQLGPACTSRPVRPELRLEPMELERLRRRSDRGGGVASSDHKDGLGVLLGQKGMEVWGRLSPGTADRREAAKPKAAGAADPLERREFLTWWRVLEWCLIPLAFILLRFVPPGPITLAQWLLLLVAGLLFASPVVLSSYREYVKGQAARSAGDLAVEYRLRLGLTLGEAITPMGHLLGRIAGGRREERAVLLGQLRQRGVDAAASLATPERARAVLFVLDGKKLRPAAWAGRPEPPREELTGGDPPGDAAYRLVERHDRILVPDTRDPEAMDFDL